MTGKSKILVIGGTGYIRKFIVQASADAAHPTFVLVRESTLSNPAPDKSELLHSFRNSGVNFITGDLYDHESLVKSVGQVDVVISTVGYAHLNDQDTILAAIQEAGWWGFWFMVFAVDLVDGVLMFCCWTLPVCCIEHFLVDDCFLPLVHLTPPLPFFYCVFLISACSFSCRYYFLSLQPLFLQVCVLLVLIVIGRMLNCAALPFNCCCWELPICYLRHFSVFAEKSSTNRKLIKDPHSARSKSFARISGKLQHRNPDNKPPSRDEMFLKTRKRDEKLTYRLRNCVHQGRLVDLEEFSSKLKPMAQQIVLPLSCYFKYHRKYKWWIYVRYQHKCSDCYVL